MTAFSFFSRKPSAVSRSWFVPVLILHVIFSALWFAWGGWVLELTNPVRDPMFVKFPLFVLMLLGFFVAAHRLSEMPESYSGWLRFTPWEPTQELPFRSLLLRIDDLVKAAILVALGQLLNGHGWAVFMVLASVYSLGCFFLMIRRGAIFSGCVLFVLSPLLLPTPSLFWCGIALVPVIVFFSFTISVITCGISHSVNK